MRQREARQSLNRRKEAKNLERALVVSCDAFSCEFLATPWEVPRIDLQRMRRECPVVKCPKAVIFMSPELSSWISVVKCPFFFRSTPSLAAGLVPYCRIRKIVEACRNYSGSLLGNWSRGSFLIGEMGAGVYLATPLRGVGGDKSVRVW